MKLIVFFCLVLTLAACDSENGHQENASSLDNLDLSGTWLRSVETKTFRKGTNEYLHSRFNEDIIVMEETNVGVKVSECHNFPNGFYITKTDSRLYFGYVEDDGHVLKEDGSLVNSYFDDPLGDDSDIYLEVINTLSLLSSTESIDYGSVKLNGPISIEEYNQVCLARSWSNLGVNHTIGLIVPFDNDSLAISLDIEGDLEPGTYTYEYKGSLYSYKDSNVHLNITSGAREFDEIIESNALYPNSVTIDISESSNERVIGTFNFIDYRDQENPNSDENHPYSGEFEIIYFPSAQFLGGLLLPVSYPEY